MRVNQPQSGLLNAHEIIPGFLETFKPIVGNLNVSLGEQRLCRLGEWLASKLEHDAIVTLGNERKDDFPVMVRISCALISEMLTVSMGGQSGSPEFSHAPGKIDIRLLHALAPKMANALGPLLRAVPSVFSVWTGYGEQKPELPSQHQIHSLEVHFQIGEMTYNAQIAIPETKTERRAADSTKLDKSSKFSRAAEDVARTSVRLDVTIKMEAMTLEQLNTLDVGDFLPLLPTNLQHAKLAVRGHQLFHGLVGRTDQNFGFKITGAANATARGSPGLGTSMAEKEGLL